MSKRNLHVPKSTQHRQDYRKYIETLDYEPTVDDKLNFQQTSQTGEDLREQTTDRKRPSSPGQQLGDHFRNNWPVWALALIGIAIVYLLYDSRVASERLSTKLDTQVTNLNDTRSCAQESQKHNQDQDVKIAETGVRVEALSKIVDETRTDVKELRKEAQSASTDTKSLQRATEVRTSVTSAKP